MSDPASPSQSRRTLQNADLAELAELRNRITNQLAAANTLTDAAQRFTSLFVELYPSVILARLFLVIPYEKLPSSDQEFATRVAREASAESKLGATTPVLSLIGTNGVRARWRHRELSKGHLAIPLLSKSFVDGIPMLAQLLADVDVDLSVLDPALPIASRPLLGSRGQCFYVPDATHARDHLGRPIIASQLFVAEHQVRTVFGMAGTYAEGALLAAIFFTTEALDRMTVDRFPSLLANVRMVTSHLVTNGTIY